MWNGSLTSRPTDWELTDFWHQLGQVEDSLRTSTSPSDLWNANSLQLIRLNRTRPNGTLVNGTRGHFWEHLRSMSFLNKPGSFEPVQIESESGAIGKSRASC